MLLKELIVELIKIDTANPSEIIPVGITILTASNCNKLYDCALFPELANWTESGKKILLLAAKPINLDVSMERYSPVGLDHSLVNSLEVDLSEIACNEQLAD